MIATSETSTRPTSPLAADALLRAGRAIVLIAGAALLGLFAASLVLWGLHSHDLLPRFVAPDTWSAQDLRAVLDGWGVPVNWWISYFMLLELVLAGVAALAAYAVLRGTVSWFRLYLAAVLVLYGTMSGWVPWVFGAAGLTELSWLQGLAWLTLFPLAYVFPDGRFVPRWGRWFVLGWLLMVPYLLVLGLAGVRDDSAVATLPLLVLFGTAAVAAIFRYVRVASREQRRQIRWVVVAFALRFGYSLLIVLTPVGWLQREVSPRGLLTYAIATGASYVVAGLLPVAIVIAIVWHRLFDVEVWLNRALVYGGLTAFVVGGYASVVAGVGVAWPAGDDWVLPLLATALVAVAFHPVRERLQRAVSRVVYGQRAEPYAVVAHLGRRLETALPPDAVLQTMVETIGPALRLRYAHAALAGRPGVTYPPSAVAQPTEDHVTFPLQSHGEQLGTLVVAPRPGEMLTAGERELLAEVTRQAGVAVRAARLTADLRRSRERIVTAQEEERRRLHRDLHDGLGPTMASLFQRVDAARGVLRTDPDAAERLLQDVGTQARTTIADLRRLIYSLRPPALDDLGLVGAIEQMGMRINARPDQLAISVDGSALPALAAVVEVAAYRIAGEALTNVVRHASASHAIVHLTVAADSLLVEVRDDGTGIVADAGTGVGLGSMRERALEIGGSVTVSPNHPQGTLVRATLPLTVEGGG